MTHKPTPGTANTLARRALHHLRRRSYDAPEPGRPFDNCFETGSQWLNQQVYNRVALTVHLYSNTRGKYGGLPFRYDACNYIGEFNPERIRGTDDEIRAAHAFAESWAKARVTA